MVMTGGCVIKRKWKRMRSDVGMDVPRIRDWDYSRDITNHPSMHTTSGLISASPSILLPPHPSCFRFSSYGHSESSSKLNHPYVLTILVDGVSMLIIHGR